MNDAMDGRRDDSQQVGRNPYLPPGLPPEYTTESVALMGYFIEDGNVSVRMSRVPSGWHLEPGDRLSYGSGLAVPASDDSDTEEALSHARQMIRLMKDHRAAEAAAEAARLAFTEYVHSNRSKVPEEAV